MIGRGWVDEPENANPSDGRDADAAASARAARDEEPDRVWTNEDFTVDNDLADDEVTADDLVVGLPTRPVVGPAIRRNARWWCAAGLIGLSSGQRCLPNYCRRPTRRRALCCLARQRARDASDGMLTEISDCAEPQGCGSCHAQARRASERQERPDVPQRLHGYDTIPGTHRGAAVHREGDVVKHR